MRDLEGLWRLVDSRAWDESRSILAPPYGHKPVGELIFRHGRMLAAVCIGDADVDVPDRGYASYGGPYTFDGRELAVEVDMASDPSRVGGRQVRAVSVVGNFMTMLPPQRAYGPAVQQRELLWEQVWRPDLNEATGLTTARKAAGWEP